MTSNTRQGKIKLPYSQLTENFKDSTNEPQEIVSEFSNVTIVFLCTTNE